MTQPQIPKFSKPTPEQPHQSLPISTIALKHSSQTDPTEHSSASNIISNSFAQHAAETLAQNYRLTPATLYSKIDSSWIPKPFLLEASLKIAQTITRPNGRLIISWPPRHGKPCDIKSLVLMGDGTHKKLGDIIPGDYVISHTGKARKVIEVHDQGILDSIKVSTICGREIVTALDHPYMTESNNQITWTDAVDLQQGQQLFSPENIQIKSNSLTAILTISESRLIGYLIGDGNFSIGGSPRIACFDPILDKSIQKHAKIAFEGASLYEYPSDKHRTWGILGSAKFFTQLGFWGKTSHTKRIPEICFKQSKEIIAHLCGAYFDTDGSVGGHIRRKNITFTYISCNPNLLKDFQRLLLRLGIRSMLRGRWQKGGYNAHKGGSMEYRLEVTRRADVEKFTAIIPLEGIKDKTRSGKIKEIFGSQKSKPKLRKSSNLVGYIDDEILEVELCRPTHCKCLTVEVDETFLVEDIIVHNSRLATIATPIWILENFPSLNIILSTYGADLSTDFGREVRDLFESNTSILDERIRRDVKSVGRFMTTKGGGMLSVGLGGAITGKGADVFLIDDYIKTMKEAQSKSKRDDDWEWFTGTAYHRLEPNASMIIIATRWHKDDLIGRITRAFPGEWEHLKFHAEAKEGDPLGREVGEALFPERYDEQQLADRKMVLGTYFFNALYQQEPEDDESKLTDRHWIEVVDHPPTPHLLEYVRIWDFGGGKGKENDPSVGTLIGVNLENRTAIILDVYRKRGSPETIESEVLRRAIDDGPDCKIVIEQEPGASGIQLVSHYKNNILFDYKVVGSPTTSNKVVRAQPFLAACESGKIKMLKRSWNATFLDEFEDFPSSAHDDQVDTCAMGYNNMLSKRKSSVSWGRKMPRIMNENAEDLSNRSVSGVTWGR